MKKEISRRRFIEQSGRTALAVGAGIAGLPYIAGGRQSSAAINVGIIGTGDRGGWLADIMQSVSDLQLAACCDVLPKHLKEGMAYAQNNARAYSDYRALLDDKNLDAVIVATPLHLHHRMAIDALSAGKHVFLEKTMTYNINQALDLTRTVKSSDRIFQVGYQLRCNPLLQEIKEMMDSEVCGRITHVRCCYHRNGNWRRKVEDPNLERLINWRMYRAYSGGLMAELCSHHIDLVNWMLGTHPLKASGFGGIDFWKDGRETYDNVYAMYQYPDGVKAVFTSITTNAHYGISLQFMGTLGAIEIYKEEGQEALFFAERELVEREKDMDGYTSATHKAWEKGEGVKITVDDQPREDHQTSGIALKHFADCIRDNKRPVSNEENGLQAAIAVHMANEAMRNEDIRMWKPEYNI